jgi:hypothetical protein
MDITPQILSIPPYLSTPWKNISSLHAIPEGERFKLLAILNNRMRVTVPDLGKVEIDAIFKAHAVYGSEKEPSLPIPTPGALSFPLAGGSGLDVLNAAMQHDPLQANAPLLPKEILDKIAGISKVIGIEGNVSQLPKAEPHCNCPFCQIARALYGESCEEQKEEEELIVLDEDLTFRNWNITESSASDKLYIVENPFDPNEHYSVFLGDPLGCTCGQKNCEHIRAVLST